MSYGIIRIQKMSRGLVKGIQIHDQREKDHSNTNSDIDFQKSYLNYDLCNTEKINFNQLVKSRINELNLKKAVRKDAIVMCQCLITSDNSFFNKMSDEEQNKFFEKAYKFICDKYGKQNIISATVHNDEKTPHIHVNFVPVTFDGRLCAKDLFTRKNLSMLHDEFYRFNQENGYNLERGESKETKQIHLDTEEYKLKTAYKNIELKKKNINIINKELDELENIIKLSYKKTKCTLEDILHIDEIEIKKSITGQLKINKIDYDNLINLAKKSFVLEEDIKKLKSNLKKYENLVEENKLNISENLRINKKIIDLRNKNNKLIDNLRKFIEYIDIRNLSDDFNNYIREQNIEKEIKQNEKLNSMEI